VLVRGVGPRRRRDRRRRPDRPRLPQWDRRGCRRRDLRAWLRGDSSPDSYERIDYGGLVNLLRVRRSAPAGGADDDVLHHPPRPRVQRRWPRAGLEPAQQAVPALASPAVGSPTVARARRQGRIPPGLSDLLVLDAEGVSPTGRGRLVGKAACDATVDALVAATALAAKERHGSARCVVLTSDPDDLSGIVADEPAVRVVAV